MTSRALPPWPVQLNVGLGVLLSGVLDIFCPCDQLLKVNDD
jgi:hypothetical protein